jgi:hypothetical protein
MYKWLIGPALTGAGWLAGSYYGADAQQLVQKGPDATYEGVSNAVANMPQSGMTAFDGGKPMPYELRVDRDPGRQLVVHVLFDGREGGRTQIDFAPQGNGGEATMITATAHADRAVLTQALAGTSKARLAYAPDWMLNLLTVRPLLQQLARQIESGAPTSIGGMSQADWEAQQSAEDQRRIQQWRQYEATAPTTDPNADAQRYLKGN